MSLTLPVPLVLADVDDYLGPATSRFFGSGYRKTTPALRQLVIRHATDGSATLESRGSLGVGDLWSVKGTTAQQPHLGTTDAIVLALEAAEALLAARYSPSFLPLVYVKELTITAGSVPIEDELSDFAVSATTDGKSPSGVLTVSVEMSSMRAVVALHHPLCVASSADLQTESADALVGDARRRVYGGIYKTRRCALTDIRLHPSDLAAAGTLEVLQPKHSSGEVIGLEANYQPGLSLLESFVATLQLGQVLLYELDNLTRADSDTLWMRKTTVRASGPPSSILTPLPLDVRLRRARILPLKGENWRCADIVGRVGDHLDVICDVAHKIPS